MEYSSEGYLLIRRSLSRLSVSHVTTAWATGLKIALLVLPAHHLLSLKRKVLKSTCL